MIFDRAGDSLNFQKIGLLNWTTSTWKQRKMLVQPNSRASIYVELPPDNPASNVVISANKPPFSSADVEVIGQKLEPGHQKQVESRRGMRKERTDEAVKVPNLFQGLLSEKQKVVLAGVIGATVGFGIVSIVAAIWRKLKNRTRHSRRWVKPVEGEGSWAEDRSKYEWHEEDARRHARQWVQVKK